MRSILALVLLTFPLLAGEASARKERVITRGSGPVPGAIVCPDFRALQAGFRSFSAMRGPPPEYFGCTIVMPGTVMTLEGEGPGGVPLVSGLLPHGVRVRGVTLHGMVERFVPKPKPPKKAAVAPAKPAPAQQPEAPPKAEAQQPGAPPKAEAQQPGALPKAEEKGSVPFPEIQNSPDTVCEAQRPCNGEEFDAKLGVLRKRWALMPAVLQEACAGSATVPALEQCVASQTASWSSANPDKETPWMFPPDQLDR